MCFQNTAKKLTTRVKVCKIMLLKENRDGFYKAFLSRASFRRAGASGQKVFAVSSLHISNFFCQEKGYCQDHPGDFNGTAWGCRSRNNLSTFDEVFSDCALPTPPGPTPFVGTWIHPELIGRTSVVSQASRLSTFLECEQTWCFVHPSDSTRPETE